VTCQEWTAKVTAELQAAGFDVIECCGFPLVKPNFDGSRAGHDERVRLLKFHTTLPTDRRIYAEGMLFLPAGSYDQAVRELRGEGKL
jgi:hypothetical protein